MHQPESEFDVQNYPTVEQTIVNNASVLYRRKKHFLGDLRKLVCGTCYILIGLLYLRDLSFMSLAARSFLNFSITHPFPQHIQMAMSENNKKFHSSVLLRAVLTVNIFAFVLHLFTGAYTKSPSTDGYLHGGLLVQFIGERLPFSVWELLGLDVAILFVQLVYHSLMCVTDDSVVLQVDSTVLSDEGSARLEIETDGYNGNVELVEIDLWDNIAKVLRYQQDPDVEAPVLETPQISRSFFV